MLWYQIIALMRDLVVIIITVLEQELASTCTVELFECMLSTRLGIKKCR